MKILALALVALAVVPAANAELVRTQRLTDMAALVAGRQVDVACETDPQSWPQGTLVRGFYDHPPVDRIRIGPNLCAFLDGRNKTGLGQLLMVVAHEAAHARGIRDEGCADVWGLVWAQDLARRFYDVPFFTPASGLVADGAMNVHRFSGQQYQGAC